MSAGIVSAFDTVCTSALALPVEQRLQLAERLRSSVEGPLEDNSLFDEIDRREAEVASGKVSPIPFDQAMREVRNQIAK